MVHGRDPHHHAEQGLDDDLVARARFNNEENVLRIPPTTSVTLAGELRCFCQAYAHDAVPWAQQQDARAKAIIKAERFDTCLAIQPACQLPTNSELFC